MKHFRKIIKYLGYIVLLGLATIIFLFYRMSRIQSDKFILDTINTAEHIFELKRGTYQDIKYRYVISKNFDSMKPTIVLVHGSIGSITNFQNYIPSFSDADVNILILDRPNYGNDFNKNYERSIAFEALLVNDLSEQYWSKNKNIILGYSYGGPIVLYAHSIKPHDSVVLVSPAIDPLNEFIPIFIHVYKWSLTRSLIPRVWIEASKEKLGHVSDLEQYVDFWKNITGTIIHIHGDSDIIVPYENVNFLESQILSNHYSHIKIDGGGHGILWNNSDIIIQILQEQLA